jgi:prevent-host-death family protein
MKVTTLSSREFNQDVSRAKRAANKGPVIITDRGEPAYVLMSHTAYERLTGSAVGLLELLYYPGADEIDFDPPRLHDNTFRPIDFL